MGRTSRKTKTVKTDSSGRSTTSEDTVSSLRQQRAMIDSPASLRQHINRRKQTLTTKLLPYSLEYFIKPANR
ncbi:hypothetical protein Btru_065677 [Bulinus truncatus]|nr:hypothetical protein Btru_065677 [Bulinus truncatus]